jgi:hypothetical protein
MAEHIEGGVDELRKVDQFQNEAQPSLAVIVLAPLSSCRTNFASPSPR